MISWTIPTTYGGLGGVGTTFVSTSSTSQSSTWTGLASPAPTVTVYITRTESSTFFGSTIISNGSWSFRSSATNWSSSRFGKTDSSHNGSVDIVEGSSSTPASLTSGFTTFYKDAPRFLQTSTTATVIAGKSETTSATYYDESVKTTFFTTSQFTTITIESVTTLNETTITDAATVYQAETNGGWNTFSNTTVFPEILCFVENIPNTWSKNFPASEIAQTGTRFTKTIEYNSRSISLLSSGPTTSSSYSQQRITQSINVTTTSFVVLPSTTVNRGVLPNTTKTESRASTITAIKSFSREVFEDYYYTLGRIMTFTNISATSYTAESWGQSIKTLFRQIGTLTFHSTGLFSTKRSITLTSLAFVTHQTSNKTISVIPGQGTRTRESGSTASFDGYELINENALCEINFFGAVNTKVVTRKNYATTGAIIGNNSGGWFAGFGGSLSAPFSTLTNGFITALNGNGRLGQVLFPRTNSTVTVESNSITWIKSGLTKTISFVVAGDPFTIEDVNPINKNGGYEIGAGCTIVDTPAIGAYVDRINKETTYFDGNATVLTEGQSSPNRLWQGVTQINQPLGLMDNNIFNGLQPLKSNGYVWNIPRNTTGFPAH